MKLNLAALLLVFFLYSCNNDIQIYESKDNFVCRQELTCFGSHSNYPVINGIVLADRHDDIENSEYQLQILKKYPISEPDNVRNLKNSKTLMLKNTSETKVYKVTIQKKTNNKSIQYEDYMLEPTAEICLGCSKEFFVDLLKGGTLTRSRTGFDFKPYLSHYIYPKYEGKVREINEISYKIHNTEVTKEY